MKVAAIVGSIRKESFNLKLAYYIQHRYKHLFQLDVLNIRDLPFTIRIRSPLRRRRLSISRAKSLKPTRCYGSLLSIIQPFQVSW